MTPLSKIRKTVATRSALPSGVIHEGAEMPPYFNLLLVVSSYFCRMPQFFVQIAHGKILHTLHQIGHRGNSGFTSGFRYISDLAFETVRMVCKSRISEVGRCTCFTVGVISPSPLKLG